MQVGTADGGPRNFDDHIILRRRIRIRMYPANRPLDTYWLRDIGDRHLDHPHIVGAKPGEGFHFRSILARFVARFDRDLNEAHVLKMHLFSLQKTKRQVRTHSLCGVGCSLHVCIGFKLRCVQSSNNELLE
jgi:hypothetical protein